LGTTNKNKKTKLLPLPGCCRPPREKNTVTCQPDVGVPQSHVRVVTCVGCGGYTAYVYPHVVREPVYVGTFAFREGARSFAKLALEFADNYSIEQLRRWASQAQGGRPAGHFGTYDAAKGSLEAFEDTFREPR
jgi:hypothetical protein